MPSNCVRWRRVFAISLLSSIAAAQETTRWLADLGDAERGEAAELALVRLGSRAAEPLGRLLGECAGRSPPDLARLLAALRVIDLLGRDAAEIAPAISDLFKDTRSTAIVELIWAAGSLAPYGTCKEWDHLSVQAVTRIGASHKEQALTGFQRQHVRAHQNRDEDTDALLERLRGNEIFAREVTAELLGDKHAVEAIEPLRRMLMDRETRPRGWDQMRHNGFVVAIDDAFRFRAGEALLRIAAEDPRSAIGWACRAALHPHRQVRLEALRSLARFGLASSDTVPELLAIAHGDDHELAAEALKVLGMAGREAGKELRSIEELAHSKDATVARLARGVAAQLRAMSCEARPEAAPTDQQRKAKELAAQMAALDEPRLSEAAWVALMAAGADALPALLERVRIDHVTTPDSVVRLIGAVGRKLDQPARDDARRKVLQRHSESWSTAWMSTVAGASQLPALDLQVAAELTVGDPRPTEELIALLTDKNACVRLEAARRLAERPDAIRGPAGGNVRVALLEAARAEHPTTAEIEVGNRTTSNLPTPVGDLIQAVAAAALVGTDVAAAQQPELLDKVLARGEAGAVGEALRAWGTLPALNTLTKALADPRAEVMVAAATAIGRLGPAAAAAIPALERACSAEAPAVTAAVRAALALVKGGG